MDTYGIGDLQINDKCSKMSGGKNVTTKSKWTVV